MMKMSNILLVVAMILLPFSAVNAAMITKVVTFSAGPFTASPAGAAPVNPVSGEFTITLDTAVDATNETAGIMLDSLNIALGSALAYNYDSASDRLEVGGLQTGVDLVQFDPATNDFWLFIDDAFSGTPLFVQLGYAQVSAGDNIFFTENQDGSVTVKDPAVVPLPAALPLFVSALGLFGFWGRRKQQTLAAA